MFPMTITLHNEAQLRAVFKVLGVAAELETIEAPAPTVKEAKVAKPAKAEQPKVEEPKDEEPATDDTNKAYTIDDAKRLTTEVVKAGKRDAMVALLAEFKAKTASALTPEQVPGFCTKAEALLS